MNDDFDLFDCFDDLAMDVDPLDSEQSRPVRRRDYLRIFLWLTALALIILAIYLGVEKI